MDDAEARPTPSPGTPIREHYPTFTDADIAFIAQWNDDILARRAARLRRAGQTEGK